MSCPDASTQEQSAQSQPKKRVVSNDPAHVMDFAPLDLGYAPASKTSLFMVDLKVHVFGLEEIKGSKLPVAVVILSHGFANKAKDMDAMASGLIGHMRHLNKSAAGRNRKRTRDVLVVTLDQRNHGERRVNREKFILDNDPRRITYMATVQTGAIQDSQLIRTFLPGYLWPDEEREVVEWMACGISMGGHTAWRLVRDDPSVHIVVPIISVPNERLGDRLMTRGANPATVTPAARSFFAPPGGYPLDLYKGKKILSLHGELDQVISVSIGEPRFSQIRQAAADNGHPEYVQQVIEEGVGHVCTPQMVRLAAEWFWRWGLSEEVDRARL